MTTPTLFASEPKAPDPDTRIRLGAGEARHARALRLTPGDPVRVTDGRGRLWEASIEEAGRSDVVCALEGKLRPPPTLPVEIAFGVANKDRTLWMIEKAVELGARSLQPVEFRRSRSVADAGRSRGFWRKATRRAVSALKQCGGARLPEIGPVRKLDDYLARRARSGMSLRRLLARGAERPLLGSLSDWTGDRPLRLVVGPEGGLESEEARRAEAGGFRAVSLGGRTLRFETAVVAGLAVAGQRLASSRVDAQSRKESHG